MFDDLEKNNQDNENLIPKVKSNFSGNISEKNHLFDKEVKNENEKVDDIFSDTDYSKKPTVLQPKKTPKTEKIINDSDSGNNKIKKISTLIIFVIVLAAVIIGGYIFLKKVLIKSSVMDAGIVNQVENSEIKENNKSDSPSNSEAFKEEPIEDLNLEDNNDTDQDGLTDVEEKKLGLDPAKPDSDEDGLFDREEVKIYKTDPLNKDTDGDGYEDGAEVKSGYNPNGEGKLFELP